MSTYTTISVAQDGPVTRITIEREKQLNALNSAVIEELTDAFQNISSETRAVVLAGSGEKAFVAGADIAAMKDMDVTAAHAFSRQGQRLTQTIEACHAVTIARVQGFALGGGCELAMACDIIVAGERAKFGQPEVNLGLIPGFGGTQRLVRRLGLPRAMDLLCCGQGRSLSADEALQMGLVSRVAPQEELDQEIGKIIRALKKTGPNAVAETKRLARMAEDCPLPVGLEAEASTFAAGFGANEAKEGLSAFLEKRSPAFSG